LNKGETQEVELSTFEMFRKKMQKSKRTKEKQKEPEMDVPVNGFQILHPTLFGYEVQTGFNLIFPLRFYA